MPIIKILAKDYKTRDLLENHVKNTIGLTPEPKLSFQIVGTEEELKDLFLSSKTTFWGITCVCTDEKEKPVAERPNRGEIYKPKIINQDTNIDIKNSEELK